MPGLISRSIVSMNDLPNPPGTPERSTGVNQLVALGIVVVVLCTVVLIAWLLKPLVARRLAQPDVLETANGTGDATEAQTQTIASVETVRVAPEVERADQQTQRGADVQASAAAVSPEDLGPPTSVEVGPIAPPVRPSSETPVVEQAFATAAQDRDTETERIVGVTLTVRELLDYANTGQLLRGFALYTDSFLRRFRAESGLSEEEFEVSFAAVTPPPPEDRAALGAITDVEVLPDGRVSALVSYSNGDEAPPPERFIFVRADGERWLIDDIVAAA
jgi:hypothetical protein